VEAGSIEIEQARFHLPEGYQVEGKKANIF
jgi:hypothetical protein